MINNSKAIGFSEWITIIYGFQTYDLIRSIDFRKSYVIVINREPKLA